MGKIIGQESIMVSAEKKVNLPLNELYQASHSSGMYFIKLEQGDFSMISKVIL
jgi:hypothetical protein